MIDVSGVARSSVFAGLPEPALELIAQRARPRTFRPGEELCHVGEPSDRCWVITAGLVDVLGASGDAPAGEVLARQRKGATVGEVAATLGEPHSETVIASVPTTALELRAADLRELVERFPNILLNMLQSAHGRVVYARARSAERSFGATVAVAVGASVRRTVAAVLAAAGRASPHPVTSLDRSFSFAGAVTAAEELAVSHATVLLPVELGAETVATLLRESDRVVALAGTAVEVAELGEVRAVRGLHSEVEVVLIGREAERAAGAWSADAPLRVVRTCQAHQGLSLSNEDIGWLARHLTGTKLGLALGAGGARGYAHVGVLEVLQEAGYVIDYVAGSSIGAIVGAYLALGADAPQIDRKLRAAFTPDAVGEIFKTSLGGRSTGVDVMTQLLRETTDDRTFADTRLPLTVMTVDLSKRAPAPLRDGPLWEALLAATSLAGMFPPYERGGQRLVDGLALIPVPTGSVLEDGADVTVSVNLISADGLARWPGGVASEPPKARRRRGVLDDLLDVMDLSQLAESTRHAELADVAITPRFGPATWRDFHLADQFLAAGRIAAQRELPALTTLALPTGKEHQTSRGGVLGREDTVRI